jgi:16S rRNA U516 pseudouridylate synthase RsuA-like enzyme
MLEALGHPVTKLMRVAFGPVELGTLQPGEWRDIARGECQAKGKRQKAKGKRQKAKGKRQKAKNLKLNR